MAGTRVRAGNAMHRSRAAILDGAARCVEQHGVVGTTMAGIADTASVAKATLYNHFRTKDDVLSALVTARVDALADACRAVAAGRPLPVAAPGLVPPDVGAGLAAALRVAAAALASSGPLRRIAADEPAVAARLSAPVEGPGWDAVRARVAGVLAEAGARHDRAAVDLVLRWLAGQVLAPASADELALAVALLAGGLRSDTAGGPAGPAG